MLFTNSPEAQATVIEQIRRDHGQHPATFTDVTPAGVPNSPTATGARLGCRLSPVAAG